MNINSNDQNEGSIIHHSEERCVNSKAPREEGTLAMQCLQGK